MFNWREVPFVRILLPFILGIITCLYWDYTTPFFNYILLFLICCIAVSVFRKTNFKWQNIIGLLINLFFFLLAYQLCFFHNHWHFKNHFRQFLHSENLIVGTVDNPPSHKARSIQIVLKTSKIGSNYDELHSCKGKIILHMRNDVSSQKIEYGDLLVLKAFPRLIAEPLNPDVFNYKKYLAGKNIHYQAFIKSGRWKVLQKNQGNKLLSMAYRARKNLIHILAKHLGKGESFAVASALVLGYKEELSEELKNAYATTGAMHVLAVSGLHVGLIWGIIAFFLNLIRWKHPLWHWTKTWITILLLWLFALITGASPSVLRAATMFSFVLIGNTLNRNTNIYNTLAASAFCLLLFNPFLLLEIGFQLSYLAVIGIVYWYQKVYGLWYIEHQAGDYIWKLSAVAIAAQLSTFPLSMYYFQQFPVYFLLSGLIVVPFAFLILGMSLVLFFSEYLLPFFAGLFAKILFGAIWLMNALIFLIEKLPSGSFKNIWIEFEVLLLLFLLIALIVLAINLRNIKYLKAALAVLFMIGFFNLFSVVQKVNQKKIIFYHIPEKTMLDFIKGEELVRIADQNIRSKTMDFVGGNFITKSGVKKQSEYILGEEVQTNSFYSNVYFIQFDKIRIAFPEELPKVKLESKIKVDYILARNNYNYSIRELMQFFEFEKIVFDGNLSTGRRATYKKECEDEQVDYYDINVRGAFIIDLNKN